MLPGRLRDPVYSTREATMKMPWPRMRKKMNVIGETFSKSAI